MDLPIHIDRRLPRSMQVQLTDQLKAMILDGRLTAGTKLPSSRAMAQTLGISRNVVLAAYDELFAEGYIEGRHGSGTYVVDDLPALPNVIPPARSEGPRWLRKRLKPAPDHVGRRDNYRIDFRLGRPSMEPLPDDLWRRLWREMASEAPPVDYGPAQGYPNLREAIAGYLGRSRGIACDPDAIIVTSGSSQAVDLIARATLEPGDLVGYEEPGYPVSRGTLEMNQARLVPIPVDDDGLDVIRLASLPESPLLVFVTPSHQYPTGARMSVSRRLALLDWARRYDGLIIEDDYDSELRFDAMPLPALAGLEHTPPGRDAEAGRVVYIGTFSKVLTPALRAGYIVAPPALRERLVEIKQLTDFHTAWPVQRVLAGFIESGRLEQQIRRIRRHYAEKRALIGEIFGPLDGIASLRGLEAGLHVYLDLMDSIDAATVARQAADRGVRVSTIDGYYIGKPDRNGLLLGYGGLRMPEIAAGGRILVDVIKEMAEQSQSDNSRMTA